MIKDKKKLMEVKRALEVVQEQTGEFIKPEMEFVLVDNWDETEDGKFDTRKVVEEDVFGKTEGHLEAGGQAGPLEVPRAASHSRAGCHS